MQTLDEESIFQQAIGIKDQKERIAFLDSACGENSDALNRVGLLVRDHFGYEGAEDATRACSVDRDILADIPKIGNRIGPYKLLQEIGDGGMGVVFMAEQTEPVKRKVALKVIKFGMDTRRVVARFESERQAMAMMDHPCITRILDAGATDEGRPFFVMELVHGKSITEYCDEKQLPLRERLRIFVQVCNAIEHAHQKGVIHRDIKPNNIMVTNQDGRPVPKIIDFGIAKAINEPLTDKTMFTNYGEMVGTPLYMSPEQSEMSDPDVDTRTDIYSLGVLLYELLTGTIPFHDLKQKGLQALREALRTSEPQLASTRINNLGDTVEEISSNRGTDVRSLHRFVRGELDWILMKCLAVDRNQRYQSAGELSSEIVRYLNGELVEAAAPTWWYRTRKFVRRHKTGVAVAAGFTAILLAGSVFSTMMALKANAAENLANSRLTEAETERDRAVLAEQRLAELERKQRNKVAFHQAASSHNTSMVKRILANRQSTENGEPTLVSLPRVQVKPLESCLHAQFPNALETVTARNSMPSSEDFEHASNWIFDGDAENGEIEIIVMPDDPENEEALLRSILHHQREAFGKKDVLVARTLNQLGKLTSYNENWEQSELYFREAIEILGDEVQNNNQLAVIRMQLVRSLEKQGNLRKVMVELRDIKDNIKNLELNDEVAGFMKRVKKKIEEKRSEADSKLD